MTIDPQLFNIQALCPENTQTLCIVGLSGGKQTRRPRTTCIGACRRPASPTRTSACLKHFCIKGPGQRVSDVAESIVLAKVAEVGDVLELRAVRDVLSEGSVVDVDLLHDALHCAQS